MRLIFQLVRMLGNEPGIMRIENICQAFGRNERSMSRNSICTDLMPSSKSITNTGPQTMNRTKKMRNSNPP